MLVTLLFAATAATSNVIPVTLQQLVNLCAPKVAPRTALAVISVESGGNPWAIGDNDARRSYHPANYSAAVTLAHSLISEGHNIDAGLMQVNSGNWETYHLTAETVFDPCTNVNVGATILARAYRAALASYPAGPIALFHAFEIYNTGHANRAWHYASSVWNAGLSI